MALTFGGIKVDANVAGDFNKFQQKILQCWSWCHIMTPGSTSALFFVYPSMLGRESFDRR